jgi:trafficking protein particle complex subunit 8
LGRQAYTLGESDLAVEHFVRLLRRGMGSDGQGDVLEDFVLAYQVGIADRNKPLSF